jgi:translation initiation factor 2B subunit (eIF-2B alpha/beta/delta family)
MEELLELIIKYEPNKEEFLVFAKKLKNTFGDMKIIKNTLDELAIQPVDNLVPHSIDILQLIRTSSVKIASNLRKYLNPEDTIATFSHSKTILDVLNILKPKKIFVLESSPGGEGKLLSNELEVTNTLVEDSLGFSMIESGQINVVLIGCDAYVPDNGIVNKLGTLKLVEIARKSRVDVYVLVCKRKYAHNLVSVESDILEFVPLTDNMKVIIDS